MDKYGLKMLLRSIRSSLGRYLAILAIVALGVGFFAGLKSSQPAMQSTVDEYMRDNRMFDFQLMSSLGLTESDRAAFAQLDGVKYAEGAYGVDAMAEEKLTRAQKAKLRFTRRVEASLLDEAVGALSDAKKAHDALENAYHPCVDFEGVTALAEREINRLLKQ